MLRNLPTVALPVPSRFSEDPSGKSRLLRRCSSARLARLAAMVAEFRRCIAREPRLAPSAATALVRLTALLRLIRLELVPSTGASPSEPVGLGIASLAPRMFLREGDCCCWFFLVGVSSTRISPSRIGQAWWSESVSELLEPSPSSDSPCRLASEPSSRLARPASLRSSASSSASGSVASSAIQRTSKKSSGSISAASSR
mmetsp:Transcript_88356/g.210950  ORF Transcript_88356/g.210950 Transcript_88356/m.210950 type:complete len:200 (+) Transcript_88356:612-1211(+)